MDYKNRMEVPDEYKWDLSKRFKSVNDWNKLYEDLSHRIDKFISYKSQVLNSAENLFQILEEYNQLKRDMIKLDCYIMLKNDEDLFNQEYKKLDSKVIELDLKLSNVTAFIKPEILKGKASLTRGYIKEYAPLSKYSYYLNRILQSKRHILSEKEEKLVNRLSKGYIKIKGISATMLNSELDYGNIVDENGQSIKLIANNIRHYLSSYNRDVRKNTYFNSYEAKKQFQNTLGSNLINYMEYQDSIAKIKKYDNAIEMFFLEADIPYKVNETLNNVVNKRLDVFQKYYINLKKYLNLPNLQQYDKIAPLFNSEKSYSIDEAKAMIKEALSVFGNDYVDIINKAFDERWIDFCSYKGKANGAYCLSNYGDTPLLLVNYHGKLEDIFTLAHELGHAVNGYFKLADNDTSNYFNDLLSSEVASLTNEIVLANYIIKNSDDKLLKQAILYRLIGTIQNNLFLACYEGELENVIYTKINNGESIVPDDLNKTMDELTSKYYGEAVEQNEYTKYIWESRLHYFIPFYLYKYAVSISIACYIGKQIINGNEILKSKYLKFLHLGKNSSVVDMIKTIDVDITKENIYQSAINYFDELLDELEKLF